MFIVTTIMGMGMGKGVIDRGIGRIRMMGYVWGDDHVVL